MTQKYDILQDENFSGLILTAIDFQFPLLYNRVLSIGRNTDNIIVVKKNLTVSRHHAKIYFDYPNFIVQDNESTNGTSLNGQKIEKAIIDASDELKVGEVVFQIKGKMKELAPEDSTEVAFEDPGMTQIIDTNFEEMKKIAKTDLEKKLVDGFQTQLEEERKHLQELAFKDGLTGIYNRRFFDIELQRTTSTMKRYGGKYSLLMIDIDFFKHFNDEYGHQVGDDVLKWVGDSLIDSIRETDTPARYGGEEMVVIFTETDAKTASLVAEKIRKHIEENSVRKFPERVTVSMGLAEYPQDGITEDEILKAADTAMYHSKEHGRNKLTLKNQIS